MKLINKKCYPVLVIFFTIILLLTGCNKEEPAPEEITPRDYTPEEFNSFIFIGSNRGNPSLFKYSVNDSSVNEFWKGGREKIVELSYSPDRNSAFFITAKSIGHKGVFPYISDINLYVINSDSIVSLVQNAGSAIQVFTKWETNNAFRIYTYKMDQDNPSLLTRNAQIFNTYGKLFEEESRTFNLLTDGYPQPEKDLPELISPGNEYRLNIKQDKIDSLYFIYEESGTSRFILATNKALNRLSWSPDLMYALIEFIEKEPGSGSAGADLFLYSVKDKKIIEEWKGNTPGSYIIVNDLLIIDKGRKNKSSIMIYDLVKQEQAYIISMKNGCSLRTLIN